MNFSEYQKKSRKTAKYPNMGSNIYYAALGLGGEAGEVMNKVKKVMRDHNNHVTDEFREDLKSELGDVLWYAACLATELGLDFDDVAWANLEKLMSRMERGTLQGSGDNR